MKLLKALAPAIIALLLLAGLAYGQAALREVPVTVEVIEGERSLGVFSDGVDIQSIMMAGFRRGDVQELEFRLVNTGVEPLDLTLATDPPVLDWALLSIYPTTFRLAAGESANVTITILVRPDAPLGPQNFTLKWN